MGDCAEELEELDDVRLDIEMLRTMIDLALDKGVASDDALLKACADVLYERRVRLDELEAMLRNAPDS
jgi:hypothetical protein